MSDLYAFNLLLCQGSGSLGKLFCGKGVMKIVVRFVLEPGRVIYRSRRLNLTTWKLLSLGRARSVRVSVVASVEKANGETYSIYLPGIVYLARAEMDCLRVFVCE